MKKPLFPMLVLIAWTTSLCAQISREQADAIVLEHIQKEVTPPYLLYVNVNTPSEEGFVVTTHMGETVKAKYACWVYFVYESFSFCPTCLYALTQDRYLFVKEDNGSLLEIITNHNLVLGDLASWQALNLTSGFPNWEENNKQPLYPNPVDDWLTLPCTGESARVEIYDLKGSRFFSEWLSGEDTCRLNVSFLNAGIYMVNISGVTYKMIKN